MSFLEFVGGFGLILDHAIADGRFHRTRTTDHPKKRNGAYVLHGNRGAVRNFATMLEFVAWRENGTQQHGQNAVAIISSMRGQRIRNAAARDEAKRLLDECHRGTHAYLARKGFPKYLGFVHPSGDLLIPMRDIGNYDQINGVQRITPDGEKKFLPGSKAKGSVYRMGTKGPTWIAEGFCTSLSIAAALADLRQESRVLVTFSASNLVHCAESVKPPAYVFADNDVSLAGEKAAIATGLPWTMWDQIGDANDCHLARNVRAVATLIRQAQDKAAGYD